MNVYLLKFLVCFTQHGSTLANDSWLPEENVNSLLAEA